MAWIVMTRPDVACAISMTARHTEETFSQTAIKEVNAIVRYLRKTRDLSLNYPRLDVNTLRIAVYADSSFNNRENARSQLGYIIILADASNKCCIIQYSSRKSRRVTRSTSSGEAFALTDGFDAAYVLRHDLQRMINVKVPILAFTDSEILFDIITRNKMTTEKRLMIDIKAIRESYNERELSNIALIASEDNPADAMTKMKSNSSLLSLMKTNTISHPIRQFVIQDSTKPFGHNALSKNIPTSDVKKRGMMN